MSGKKIHITAAVSLRVNTAPVEKLSKENVRFKSISTAYSIDYDRQLQLELREQLDEYNCFVDKLFSIATIITSRCLILNRKRSRALSFIVPE